MARFHDRLTTPGTWRWILIAAIGAIAFFTRWFRIDQWSLYGDEQYTWLAANMSLRDMWTWTSQDLHPPLYYAVVHASVLPLGDSISVLRAASAVPSALTIILLVILAARAAGTLIGVLSGLFLTFNESHLLHSQEARMYPLTGFLAILTAGAWAPWAERPSAWRFIPLVLTSIALIYTDYGGFFLIAVLVPATVLQSRHMPPGAERKTLLVSTILWPALIGVAYIPWWGYLFEQTERSTAGTAIPYPDAEIIVNVYRHALGLRGLTDIWYPVAFVLLTLGIIAIVRRTSSPYTIALTALATVTLAQLGYSALLSKLLDFKPVFDVKYVSPYMGGLAFVLAMGLVEGGSLVLSRIGVSAEWRTGPGIFVAGLLLSLMAANVVDYYRMQGPEDWRRPAHDIQRDGPVYAWPNYILEPLRYYAGDELDYKLILQPSATAATHGINPFPQLPPGKRLTLVGLDKNDQHASTIDAIFGAAKPYFRVVEDTIYRPGLELWVLESTSSTSFNVELGTGWEVARDGYFAVSNAGVVQLREGDDWSKGRLVLEFRTTGDAPVTVEAGGSRLAALSSAELPEGWTQLEYKLPAEQDTPIVLHGPASFRRIEARGFELIDEGDTNSRVDIGLGLTVRPDGLLESVHGQGCIVKNNSPTQIHAELSLRTQAGWESVTIRLERQGAFYCGPFPALRAIGGVVLRDG